MATVLAPSTERVVLHDISWKSYESLLKDFADSSAPRLTYDNGVLEIMSPLTKHERYNRTLNLLVEEAAAALGLDVESLGSTTFKREDLARGLEPDSCFYFEHAAQIRPKSQIDLLVDPPPELVIEIDVTSPSLPKLPIYAQLGMPEVWRYDGKRLSILRLENSDYHEVVQSVALPGLTSAILTSFLEESKTLTRPEWRRKLTAWLRRSGP
jgi:Uma2 family endonuclease